MAGRIWGESEAARLLYMVQRGVGSGEIEKALREDGGKRTQRAIENKISREKRNNPGAWRVQVKGGNTPRYTGAIRATSKRTLVIADMHAPFHDAAFMNAVIGLAARLRCDTCVIAGDLVDWASFSVFGRVLGVEAAEEIESARQIVHSIADTFENVIYFAGNHEERLGRKMDHLLPITQTMGWFVDQANVQLSEYHYCEIVNGNEEWYIEHPKNTSVIPTRVAQFLCSKYLKHIIMGHNHLWGMTRDKSGQFYAIETGICADPKKLQYLQMIHNTRPEVVQGAVMILEGVPLLLSAKNIRLYEEMIA